MVARLSALDHFRNQYPIVRDPQVRKRYPEIEGFALVLEHYAKKHHTSIIAGETWNLQELLERLQKDHPRARKEYDDYCSIMDQLQ